MATKRVKIKKEAFTNSKTNPSKKQPVFPRIYRFITESWKVILVSFISGLILMAIAVECFGLYKNIQEMQRLEQERGSIAKELVYWKKLRSEHRGYRDIHFKIATLEYRLGNITGAKESLDKALEIDPNFEKGWEMEKQLEL